MLLNGIIICAFSNYKIILCYKYYFFLDILHIILNMGDSFRIMRAKQKISSQAFSHKCYEWHVI